jgi:hypothetical protein
MPTVDLCGAIHLRADGYDLYPVDAGDEAFRLWRYARQIALYLEEPSERWVGEAAAPPAKEAA